MEDIRLIITNVGYIIGILFNTVIALWVFHKSTNKVLAVIFALLSAALVLFEIGHIVGINTYDSEISRFYFSLSLGILFIPALSTHWVFGVLDKLKERLREVVLMYIVAFSLLIFYLVYPELYLNLSLSKLEYLPNYYDAGIFFWMVPLYFSLVGIYLLYHLLRSYRAANPVLKNRLMYFLVTLVFGYCVGATVFFLAFDIPVDPLWSLFLSLYTLPMAYGIVRYELMDISVVAKRALMYGVVVAVVSILITAVSYLNLILKDRYDHFPLWLIPSVLSCIAVAVGALVWLRLKEVDVIKYEFITIITHKFRTPLTRIKWSSDELKAEQLSENGVAALSHIADAGTKLSELTDALVNVAETERADYKYAFVQEDMRVLVNDRSKQMAQKFADKGIAFQEEESLEVLPVEVDLKRIQFVLEVFFDNALSYTPRGGSVYVSTRREGSRAVCSIHDTGMGISKEQLSMIFIKFFRDAKAKAADTEGLGIGLYLSKKIVEKHRGKIEVSSEGENMGTTFTLSLPLLK